MRKIMVLATLFMALGLGLAYQTAHAQANNLARFYHVEAKAGHAAELDAAIEAHAQWRKQNSDPWAWTVYQVVNGTNLGDYIILSSGHTWADFDAYDAGFGMKGSAHWQENVMPHVASVESAINASDTTHVNWPADPQTVNLISVVTFHLKPGHGQAFEQAIGMFHKTIMEHKYPAHYSFGWVLNGANSGAVHLVLPYESWADMQEPDEPMGPFMVRVLGEEKAMKLFQQFDSTYHHSESMVVRKRPDLSVMHAM